MIIVRVELHPSSGGEPRELGQVIIVNDGKGTMTKGDYDVQLLKAAEYAKTPGVWKRGKVKGFPRKMLGPYDLLYRALRACVADRNKEEA